MLLNKIDIKIDIELVIKTTTMGKMQPKWKRYSYPALGKNNFKTNVISFADFISLHFNSLHFISLHSKMKNLLESFNWHLFFIVLSTINLMIPQTDKISS